MTRCVRVGVISTAHVHAESYLQRLARREDVVVVTVVDRDRERGEGLASRYGIPWRPQIGALGEEVDAVLILSENVHHRSDFEAVARPGLHVLTEKPLATTPEDGAAMLERAQAHGIHLFTALPVRTLASVAVLRETVRAQRLGRIVAMAGTNHGSRPPGWFVNPRLAGGGAVMDHVSHVIDLMHHVADGEPEAVRCLASNRFYEGGVDDAGLLLIDWDGGITATLDPSWSRTPGYPTWGDVTLEMVGETGVARLDAFNAHIDQFRSTPPTHRHLAYGEDMDALLLDAFVEAVRHGRVGPELATGRDGFRAAAVSWAAYRSLQSGELEAVPRPETV
ncbi:MAG: Gfo/Idh/MocA family protein [Clostridia bacterium]